MKAVKIYQAGNPEQLIYQDVPTPDTLKYIKQDLYDAALKDSKIKIAPIASKSAVVSDQNQKGTSSSVDSFHFF